MSPAGLHSPPEPPDGENLLCNPHGLFAPPRRTDKSKSHMGDQNLTISSQMDEL